MTRIGTSRRWARALAAIGLSLLAACGGGGSSAPGSGNEDPGGGGAPAVLSLTALGSSARTASLAWTPVSGASGYTLERKTADSAWTAVAALGAADDRYIDDGLAQNTTYTYRLAATGVEVPAAEHAATTSSDLPIVTARPTPTGAATAAVFEPNGGSLASADGSAGLALPAGAVTSATDASLVPITNPLPDGRGDGVRVHLGALPAQAPTLTLAYAAGLDTEADGLGVAAQRADGSWLSLPVAAIDKAQRTLTVELPAALVADGAARSGARPLAARAATGVSLDVDVVTYLNFYLSPREAVVKTGATQAFVPYAHTLVAIGRVCTRDEVGTCLGLPVLDTREIPFENQKDGYTRRWFVEDQEGGSAALGTVVPRAGSGAVYHAPAQEPTPNPVTVAFGSTHVKSGRTLTLRATVRVKQPIWTGTIDGTLEQSAEIGFAFSAQAVWTPMAGSDGSVFQANGTQSVHVINITCSGSPSPGTVALPPGALTIDRSVEPARYTLDVGSLWDTTITASCPGHGSASVAMTVPGRLQVEGTVSGDGTLIQGSTSMNGIFWGWSLKAQ